MTISNESSMSVAELFDVLRAAEPLERDPKPTLEQMRILVDDIWNMRDVWFTESRPEMAPFTAEQLVGLIGKFGSHRSRARRNTLEDRMMRESAQATSLVPLPEHYRVEARELLRAGVKPYRSNGSRNTRSSRNPNGFPKHLFEVLPELEQDLWPLPIGYERELTGRDIHISLSAVLAEEVTDAELVRFLERTFRETVVTPTVEHARILHWLVANNVAHKLLHLGGKDLDTDALFPQIVDAPRGEADHNYPLLQAFITVFDTLEAGRIEAMDALQFVVTHPQNPAEQLVNQLRQFDWVAPLRVRRLLLAGENALKPSTGPQAEERFGRQILTFAHEVKREPALYVLSRFEDLSEAHVIQLADRSALPSRSGKEERDAARQISARLAAMGLRNDVDVEMPEGMQAWREGKLEAFFMSRQARLDGDPEWETIYEEADLEIADR